MSVENCFLTVVTASHLYWAKALVQNLLSVEPGVDIVVFMPDLSQKKIDGELGNIFPGGVRLVGGDAIKDPTFKNLRHYFNGWEYAAVSKAFAIEFVLEQLGYKKTILLDSDIICHSDFEVAWRALDQANMVLTPHVTGPFPEDGQSPDELEMVSFGFINAGFWAARYDEHTTAMMAWIKNKVTHLGFLVPTAISISSEQTWMSCLPWIFPESVSVLRHPGLNVAYWNLHERRLDIKNDRITSNGEPLIFFHCSGFDPRFPATLTKYHVRKPDAGNEAILLPLLKEYARQLAQAKTSLPPVAADMPYSHKNLWGRFHDYRKIYGVTQRYAKRALLGAAAERLTYWWKRIRGE